MRAKLICYSLNNLTSAQRVAFRRCVYGFNDHSNNSKYSYKRTGLMNSIQHKKILDCVVIVKSSDANKVAKIMRECKAIVHVFPVLTTFNI